MVNPAISALGLTRPLESVRNTRYIGNKDMVHNDWLPRLEVDAETYEVRANGELLVCEPAKFLPMAQRYFLILRTGHDRNPQETQGQSRCLPN